MRTCCAAFAALLLCGASATTTPRNCDDVPYDRDEWAYDAEDMRYELWLANPWTAYAGAPLLRAPTGKDAEIEHVVSLREAHARACWWPRERKKRYASDLRNVVLALPVMNREKGASSVWRPPTVPGWFEHRRAEILEREFGVVEAR